ncbi:S9 family peptidase [Nicoliella spurrieriana]|uniref:S9 family peptidase n=1 Tax=Nicoliella spurrieriana TaxID=2925830 RepID=A0A976X547_9LACO|nr:S9 family peptidase [Nicoliella spurrieriana]UQS86251.1 S9 family peptidase [Nicoliella spurrieriana]
MTNNKSGVAATDLYQLKSLTQPNPVGKRSFFVENGIDEATNQYTAQIASVDVDGRYQVWARGGINLQPVGTAKNLYYRHLDANGRYQLMQMPLDGGDAVQVTDGDSIVQMRMTPDENVLVLKRVHSNVSSKFATSDRPQIRHITKLENRADGIGWLSNDKQYSLVMFDLQTQQEVVLFESKYDLDFQGISPDLTKLVFIQSTMHNLTDAVDDTAAVYLYDIGKKKKIWVTSEMPSGIFTDARFSPDGQNIVVIGNDNYYVHATVNHVYFYPIEDGNLYQLNLNDDVDAGFAGGLSTDFAQHRSNLGIFWLDDQHYIFHGYHHGYSQLYTGDLDGQIDLVRDNNSEIYDFVPIDSDHVLITASSQKMPSELRIVDLKQFDERKLYNPNAEYEQTHQYAEAGAFSYTADDHQTQISGWVMHALNFDPKQKSPVILYVHGGPHDAYGESFMHEFQTLASSGFAVVFLNPRGSTTYGQQFEKALMGHYGEMDYSDIMAGLNAALEQYADLDAERVFIAGGSYGGFFSAWAIGHTDRFKAASVQRPIIDWRALYGTGDIGIRYASGELGKDLFKDDAVQYYWDRSPLKYAKHVKTPVRIQHGEYDMRVPTNQSEAFFTAVKQTGTDVDYIRYPRSYHGLSRHGIPNLRVQRLEDITEWFRRYLN